MSCRDAWRRASFSTISYCSQPLYFTNCNRLYPVSGVYRKVYIQCSYQILFATKSNRGHYPPTSTSSTTSFQEILENHGTMILFIGDCGRHDSNPSSSQKMMSEWLGIWNSYKRPLPQICLIHIITVSAIKYTLIYYLTTSHNVPTNYWSFRATDQHRGQESRDSTPCCIFLTASNWYASLHRTIILPTERKSTHPCCADRALPGLLQEAEWLLPWKVFIWCYVRSGVWDTSSLSRKARYKFGTIVAYLRRWKTKTSQRMTTSSLTIRWRLESFDMEKKRTKHKMIMGYCAGHYIRRNYVIIIIL